ncbi:MAG: TlpA family protein disulfide reductase [Gemmatimonadetes bacterium]|uniref:TlpA family protein disulfide reductase n=1 Tax=Candidatus Kutchimonas denitrificans TaxID=3056748 RepID=A0AAE5CD58_9BACT|nr:TlpA family protein disulfide reductase [Gemmatimonadota bacterium]NIR76650.1 TlpA family protein disulfide reductase [Candidatus Kutchimonas denitrificans]NIS03419.1 TlpA family protein disulfide reductase [Gemmatimonadota bacterium]NIT69280.1 TlpA family protein disulfide reductase [Gemmatimonadota bacterium]NIU54752.1 redoxin domain-containing protein [Gemmatimonadota bacterium]
MSEEQIEFTLASSAERLLPLTPAGTFNPGMAIFPIREDGPVRGVPDTLHDVHLLHDFVDSHQYFFQSLHAGDISAKLYNRISTHIDSTVLTRQWVDVILTVAVGRNQSGQLMLVPDTDNDEDLADEEPRILLPDKVVLGSRSFSGRSVEANVKVDYFEAGIRGQRSIPVRFFLPEGAKAHQLDWYIQVHPVGSWTVRGQEYPVALGFRTLFRFGRYEFFYVDVNLDGRFDPDPTGLESYSIGMPFNIGGTGWRIEELRVDGSSLRLAAVDSTVLPRLALRAGNAAPEFTGVTLAGDSLGLENLRGRFVLLHFWAPWCVYSQREFAYLRGAHEEFGEDGGLAIVGVVEAEQLADVHRAIREHRLLWPHIYQAREDPIPSAYRVVGFPTTYLIDPDRTIVAQGSAVRGDSLLVTLRMHLTSRAP